MAEDRIPCYTDGMTTTTKHSYATTVAACGTWNQMNDQQRNTLTVAAIAHRAAEQGGTSSAVHSDVHRLVGETVSRLGLIRDVTLDVQHCLMDIAAGDVPPEAPEPQPEPRLESTFRVLVTVRDPEEGDPDGYMDIDVDFGDSYDDTYVVDGAGEWPHGDTHGHSEFIDRVIGGSDYSTAGKLRRLADYLDGKSGIVDEVRGQ